MTSLATHPNSDAITPAVHLEFIQNQADLLGAGGLEEIEAYHRALFLHHHARDLERLQQQARIHEGRLNHLESRLVNSHSKLAGLEKLIPFTADGQQDIQPSAPWNLWDRAMFGAALAGIAALLLFGVLNISFNLLESGLVTFTESPIRAYFWAALLPVGALAVKIGWDVLESPRKRDLYLWTSLVAGIAGVLVWVGAYALVYPTLSKSTNDHIESLSVFDGPNPSNPKNGITSAGAKTIDAITVAAQALAEIFLSAVLGIYMTALYSKHRPVRLAENPLFSQIDLERQFLEESVERERIALAEARGEESRLQNQLAALVAYAKSIFQKEAAHRRDQSQEKRRLLDQISTQLRDQLATVEEANSSAVARTHSPLALDGKNGK